MPSLEPGYAYYLVDQAPRYAFVCEDEYWDIGVVDMDEVEAFRHFGKRAIDGTRCNVFIKGEGTPEAVVVAQTLAAGGR